MHLATSSFGLSHTRQSRKRAARWYLAAIAGLVLVADLALLHFVFSDENPWEFLISIVVGQFASTPLLVAGIWRRLGWARLFLIVLLFFVAAVFTIVAVAMGWRTESRDVVEIAKLGTAVVLLLGANTWLVRSRRIQYLARVGHAYSEDSSLL
jgi:hypothetical protein